MTTPKALTVAQVAEQLNCTEATVRNMLKDGRLVGFKTGASGHYRVWPDALEQFKVEQEVKTTGEGDEADRT